MAFKRYSGRSINLIYIVTYNLVSKMDLANTYFFCSAIPASLRKNIFAILVHLHSYNNESISEK